MIKYLQPQTITFFLLTGLKKQLEQSMVFEPSEFELAKFHCMYIQNVLYINDHWMELCFVQMYFYLANWCRLMLEPYSINKSNLHLCTLLCNELRVCTSFQPFPRPPQMNVFNLRFGVCLCDLNWNAVWFVILFCLGFVHQQVTDLYIND